MTTKKHDNKVGNVIAVGAGIAAASVAAVLLFGHNGKKNRKGVKDWSIKMKDEVVEKAKELKVISAPVYEEIVNQVTAKYATVQQIGKDELEKEIRSLKESWNKAIKNVADKATTQTMTRTKRSKPASKKVVKRS